MKKFIASALLSVLLWIAIATIAHSQSVDASTVFKQANPWIVTIIGNNASGESVREGSGFFISSGDLVTCHHVLAGLASAYFYDAHDNKLQIMSVVADDVQRDLVKVRTMLVRSGPGQGLPLASKMPEEGEVVIAIGSPKGLTGTISEGIISAIRSDDDVPKLIQTTAATSPGSSGCPLLNTHGEVVGIVGLKYNAENVTFATPVEYLADMDDQTPMPFAEWAQNNPSEDEDYSSGPSSGEPSHYDERPDERAADPNGMPSADRASLGASLYKQGAARFEHRDFRDALDLFERSVEANPVDGVSWYMIGQCHYDMDEPVLASMSYHQAAILLLGHSDQLKTIDVLMGLGQSYFAIPLPDSALKYYRDVLTLDPDNPLALNGAGRACLLLDQDSLAYGYFTREAETHPNIFQSHFFLGMIDEQWGHLDAAQTELRTAISIHPEEPTLYVSLGQLRLHAGDSSETKELLQKALALYSQRHDPSDAKEMNDFAKLLQSAGLVQEASEASDLGKSLRDTR